MNKKKEEKNNQKWIYNERKNSKVTKIDANKQNKHTNTIKDANSLQCFKSSWAYLFANFFFIHIHNLLRAKSCTLKCIDTGHTKATTIMMTTTTTTIAVAAKKMVTVRHNCACSICIHIFFKTKEKIVSRSSNNEVMSMSRFSPFVFVCLLLILSKSLSCSFNIVMWLRLFC